MASDAEPFTFFPPEEDCCHDPEFDDDLEANADAILSCDRALIIGAIYDECLALRSLYDGALVFGSLYDGALVFGSLYDGALVFGSLYDGALDFASEYDRALTSGGARSIGDDTVVDSVCSGLPAPSTASKGLARDKC